MSITFPSLFSEYIPLIEDLGAAIGVVVKSKENMESRLTNIVGNHLIRILVGNIRQPKEQGERREISRLLRGRKI